VSNGGVLGRRNVPGVDGVSGVWSLREIANARRAVVWPPDSYFSSVVALLHMDGADGSTAFTDVKGHMFTPAGNAQIDTAQSKFGGASGLFDGTGDYLSAPASADWAFGTGDFTVEGWIRISSQLTNRGVVGNRPNGGASPPNSTWQILFYTTAGRLEVHTDSAIWLASTIAIANDTWTHVALCRAAGTLRWFIGGAAAGSTTTVYDLSTVADLQVGRDLNTAIGQFAGWLDESRIKKGEALYTEPFTPPVEPFPSI